MTIPRVSQNKEAVRRFQAATNTHDVNLLSETIDEVFHPDVLIRTPLPLQTTGAQAMKDVFEMLHQAFPDLRVSIEDLIEEGDKVVSRNVVTGTHQGAYMGRPPTGRTITYNEIFILRFEGGRVTETWGVVDVASQMKQLGLIPAPVTPTH